jgi:hypothetical protein
MTGARLPSVTNTPNPEDDRLVSPTGNVHASPTWSFPASRVPLHYLTLRPNAQGPKNPKSGFWRLLIPKLVMLPHPLFHLPSAAKAFWEDHQISWAKTYRLPRSFYRNIALQNQTGLLFVIVPRKFRRLLFPNGAGLHLGHFFRGRFPHFNLHLSLLPLAHEKTNPATSGSGHLAKIVPKPRPRNPPKTESPVGKSRFNSPKRARHTKAPLPPSNRPKNSRIRAPLPSPALLVFKPRDAFSLESHLFICRAASRVYMQSRSSGSEQARWFLTIEQNQ